MLHEHSAFRAFIRPVPGADTVQRRDGTGGLEFQPWSHAMWRQPVEHRGELGSRFVAAIGHGRRRRFEFRHGVIKLLAVGADDGLDGKMLARARATGDPGAVTASETFKQISAAHKPALACRVVARNAFIIAV